MATFSQSISSDTNDGLESGGSTWSQSPSSLFVGNRLSTSYHGGFYFTNVTIPKNSTINSATMGFWGEDATQGSPTIRFYAVAQDNFAGFDSTNRPSQLTKTTAFVNWTSSFISVDTFGDGPDITSVIQEMVNRAGWASGNALGMILWDQGNANGNNISVRDRGTGTPAASISIDYTVQSFVPLITII